jgi:hypothetical protein
VAGITRFKVAEAVFGPFAVVVDVDVVDEAVLADATSEGPVASPTMAVAAVMRMTRLEKRCVEVTTTPSPKR